MKSIFISKGARTVSVLLLLLISAGTSRAQYNIKENNIWIFGNRAGLDFNGSNPALLTTPEIPGNSTGSAVATDSTGKLLFYTNGYAVWDKNNQIMPNGNTIFPVVGRLSPFSGTQGALIVPVLDNPNQYYIFSQEATSNSANDAGVSRMWYSVVDMTLNGGLGDIVSGKKSILMDSALNGTMIAIPGNECNIWVLTHTIENNIFKAYNVTAAGVTATPVVSTAGTLAPTSYKWSRMRVSPDGKMIGLISTGNGGGITGAGVELYDFNAQTGAVSNARFIDQIGGNGIAFSPDNSKLYVTGVVPVTYTYSMFQFDVSQSTAAAITASKQIIVNTTWTDLRLAPDGKIYYIINANKIGVINSPNLSGTACNYTPDVIISTNPNQFGMYFGAEYIKGKPAATETATILDTVVCPEFNSLTLHAEEGARSYLWDNGEATGTRKITQPGTYYVTTQVDFCTSRIDTFVIDVLDVEEPVINVKGFVLGTTAKFRSYQWLLNGASIVGATDSTYTLKENGDYQVAVETENGCKDTSDIYKVTNYEESNGIYGPGNKESIVTIYPNPAQDVLYIQSPLTLNATLVSVDGKVVSESKNVTRLTIAQVSAGIYFLRLTDQQDNLIKVEKVIKQSQ